MRRFAEQAQSRYGLQRCCRVDEKVAFVGGDAIAPYRLDIVERGAETDEAGDVRRAGLELVRRIGERRLSKLTS